MPKPPPPTSDPSLPTTTTTSTPKSSSRPAPAGLLDPLAASGRSLLASARRSPVTTLAGAFFLLALVMYGEDARTIAELSIDDYLYPDADLYNVSGLPPLALPPPTCDLSSGRWVFDNASVPAYREKDCTFLTKQVTCLANGRPDDMWQYWRWQPSDCSLPTFDARRFMEAMRGKRLMFVGDSLNRNQWESLVCLVQPILSKGRKKIVKRGSLNTFYAKEYRATLEFYWAPFLVESNSDNPNFHSIKERIISPERIEAHARNWKDVDYLIFNTYIWWMNTADIKVRRPNSRYWSENDEVPRIEAYGRVFKTWSDWLNNNIDPARTSVFFMTISPIHISPQNWGNPGGIRCVKETLPYQNYSQPLDLYHDMRLYDLVIKVASSMEKVPVSVINITKMSDYRKDAHASVYTIRQGKLLTPKQKADPEKFADCIHWCLPGVPDVWNQILYTRILSKSPWRSNFSPPPSQSTPLPPQ
ncbi:putative DUF231 domain containing family protein [Zea mays]|uniref:Protein ESKIMO 1 n=1 Tax=Zea mays TaxID=4577 RepID=C0P6K5_MAIZE|nr:putative DUF231 domain containing family protein [Zea mays]ACN28621.1 unknown [Zea mays]ONM20242.1 Protein ESKIMO 1 [Zea mays]|eukprot:NP_001168546.1 putative DUF231 domain containing family protein [Zea mays]